MPRQAPGGHSHLSPRLTKCERFLSFVQDYSLSTFGSYPYLCLQRRMERESQAAANFAIPQTSSVQFSPVVRNALEKFARQLVALRRKLLDAMRHLFSQGEQIRGIPRKRAHINNHTLHALIRKFNSSELF